MIYKDIMRAWLGREVRVFKPFRRTHLIASLATATENTEICFPSLLREGGAPIFPRHPSYTRQQFLHTSPQLSNAQTELLCAGRFIPLQASVTGSAVDTSMPEELVSSRQYLSVAVPCQKPLEIVHSVRLDAWSQF